jgi:hypothetical protein
MKTYTLTLDGKVILTTKSYAQLYRYLAKSLSGGLSFGIDVPTLRALGYSVKTEVI